MLRPDVSCGRVSVTNEAYKWLSEWVDHGGFWDNDTFGGAWDLSLYGWKADKYDILTFREDMEKLLNIVKKGIETQ